MPVECVDGAALFLASDCCVELVAFVVGDGLYVASVEHGSVWRLVLNRAETGFDLLTTGEHLDVSECVVQDVLNESYLELCCHWSEQMRGTGGRGPRGR